MNLDDLREESQSDLAIDTLRIEGEAARNPVLYGKWLDRLIQLKYDRIRLSNNLKKSNAKRMGYYTGKSEGTVSRIAYDKTELRSILPADDEVIKSQSALDLIDIKIELCQETLKAINNRQFAIKHVLDNRRLEAGG